MLKLQFVKEKIWFKILIFFVAWQIIVVSITLFSTARITQVNQGRFESSSGLTERYHQFYNHNDTVHYIEIAKNGYGDTENPAPAFFPLYPILIRFVHVATGIEWINSALLISFISSYFAFYFFYLLALSYFKNDEKNAKKALLLFMFFPTAMFMAAGYTEALFCAIGFAAIYYARNKNWFVASVLAASVTAVRFPGIIFAIAVFLEYLCSINFNWKKIGKEAWPFLIAPLGLAFYIVYLFNKFHDPLFFIHAQSIGWSYQVRNLNIFSTFLTEMKDGISHLTAKKDGWMEPFMVELTFFAFWVLTFIVGILGFKKMRPSYLFIIFATLFLVCSSSNFVSVNRYVLPIFPIYLILVEKSKDRESLFSIILVIFAMGFALFNLLFATERWIG